MSEFLLFPQVQQTALLVLQLIMRHIDTRMSSKCDLKALFFSFFNQSILYVISTLKVPEANLQFFCYLLGTRFNPTIW